MKKSAVLLGVVLSFVLSFCCMAKTEAAALPEPKFDKTPYVQDLAGKLTTETENELNSYSEKLAKATGSEVVILTTDKLYGYTAPEFGTKIIRKWGIGNKEKNNGVLIFASFGESEGNRDVYISVGQGLEGALPDGKIGRIIDEKMIPHLQDDDYDAAFSSAYFTIYNTIADEYNWDGKVDYADSIEDSSDDSELSVTAIIIFVVIAVILYSIFSGGNGGGGGGRGGGNRRRRNIDYGGPNSFGGFGNWNGGSGGNSGGGGFGGFGGGSSAGGGAGRKW
ncbi:TPM domain-containing protein [Rummeliibacillus sp. JY-2-4R]